MLNLSNANSNKDYLPYLAYKASLGRWATKENDVELKQAIWDLANIKTGWAKLERGVAPDWQMDVELGQMATKPSDDHKRGFKVVLYSPKTFGEETPMVEYSGCGAGERVGLEALWAEYERVEKAPGQVAVVEFTGATPTKMGAGSSNVPNFRIVKMIDAPAELVEYQGNGLATSSDLATPVSDAVEDDEFPI